MTVFSKNYEFGENSKFLAEDRIKLHSQNLTLCTFLHMSEISTIEIYLWIHLFILWEMAGKKLFKQKKMWRLGPSSLLLWSSCDVKWALLAESWPRNTVPTSWSPSPYRFRGLLRSSCLGSRTAAKCRAESLGFHGPGSGSEIARWTLCSNLVHSQPRAYSQPILCCNFNNFCF